MVAKSVNEHQMELAVKFINVTQSQRDNLTLVTNSHVKEWYSQTREYVDKPLQSLGFLATGLFRAFQEFKVDKGAVKVRKRVQASAQLFWEGDFYLATVTAIGATSLRLELDDSITSNAKLLKPDNLKKMQQEKPLVGLLLSQDAISQSRERFLTQILSLEILVPGDSSSSSPNKIALELSFPEQFKDRQAAKIKELVRVLH